MLAGSGGMGGGGASRHCVCELVLNLTLRRERARGVIRVSNVSLIKADKAHAGGGGGGAVGGAGKIWRSMSQRVIKQKKDGVSFSILSLLFLALSTDLPPPPRPLLLKTVCSQTQENFGAKNQLD